MKIKLFKSKKFFIRPNITTITSSNARAFKGFLCLYFLALRYVHIERSDENVGGARYVSKNTVLWFWNNPSPQNYWVSGLCPSSGIPDTGKHSPTTCGYRNLTICNFQYWKELKD
jgi:hypothetical protein